MDDQWFGAAVCSTGHPSLAQVFPANQTFSSNMASRGDLWELYNAFNPIIREVFGLHTLKTAQRIAEYRIAILLFHGRMF